MGFYDILKRKKETKPQKKARAPKGDEVVVGGNKKEFQKLCKSLTDDFCGMLILHSTYDDNRYTATILLEDGNILGASFEDPQAGKIAYRKTAIARIKTKLSKTSGSLDVYSFRDADMGDVRKNNMQVLLKEPIPFSMLGMKIRLNVSEDTEDLEDDSFSATKGVRIKDLKVESGFNLLSFARVAALQSESSKKINLKEGQTPEKGKKDIKMPPMPELGMPNLKGGNLKSERIAQLKRKRQEQDQELMRRISNITKKKEDSEKKESCKVETSIDKLYQLVQKQGRVKIDDSLVRKLGVRRHQIESWALILEEHNLVELHYPAIGEPEIRKAG